MRVGLNFGQYPQLPDMEPAAGPGPGPGAGVSVYDPYGGLDVPGVTTPEAEVSPDIGLDVIVPSVEPVDPDQADAGDEDAGYPWEQDDWTGTEAGALVEAGAGIPSEFLQPDPWYVTYRTPLIVGGVAVVAGGLLWWYLRSRAT